MERGSALSPVLATPLGDDGEDMTDLEREREHAAEVIVPILEKFYGQWVKYCKFFADRHMEPPKVFSEWVMGKVLGVVTGAPLNTIDSSIATSESYRVGGHMIKLAPRRDFLTVRSAWQME